MDPGKQTIATTTSTTKDWPGWAVQYMERLEAFGDTVRASPCNGLLGGTVLDLQATFAAAITAQYTPAIAGGRK